MGMLIVENEPEDDKKDEDEEPKVPTHQGMKGEPVDESYEPPPYDDDFDNDLPTDEDWDEDDDWNDDDYDINEEEELEKYKEKASSNDVPSNFDEAANEAIKIANEARKVFRDNESLKRKK